MVTRVLRVWRVAERTAAGRWGFVGIAKSGPVGPDPIGRWCLEETFVSVCRNLVSGGGPSPPPRAGGAVTVTIVVPAGMPPGAPLMVRHPTNGQNYSIAVRPSHPVISTAAPAWCRSVDSSNPSIPTPRTPPSARRSDPPRCPALPAATAAPCR